MNRTIITVVSVLLTLFLLILAQRRPPQDSFLRSGSTPSASCLSLLSNPDTMYAQFGQDSYLMKNIIPPTKRNGFYVDLGAYQPFKYSNTAFLDTCLGWRGLCIDMNPFHEEDFKKHRTCTFVHRCVANRTHADYYLQDDELASGKEGVSRVPCEPFSAILKRYGVAHIDFLSIDIEGNEMDALNTFPHESVSVDTVLIETWWTGKAPIFDHFEDRGFRHVAEIGPDDLFVHGDTQKPWLPSKTAQWRAAIRKQQKEHAATSTV